MAPKKKSAGTRDAKAPTLRVVKSADPGPPYKVVWHSDALLERENSRPDGEKVAIQHAVEKLKAAGPRLKFPHSSAVQGTAGKGLRELRPRSGRSRWRPIYRQVAPGTFIVRAVGPEAKIDQGGFDAAVRHAAQRFASLDLS